MNSSGKQSAPTLILWLHLLTSSLATWCLGSASRLGYTLDDCLSVAEACEPTVYCYGDALEQSEPVWPLQRRHFPSGKLGQEVRTDTPFAGVDLDGPRFDKLHIEPIFGGDVRDMANSVAPARASIRIHILVQLGDVEAHRSPRGLGIPVKLSEAHFHGAGLIRTFGEFCGEGGNEKGGGHFWG